MELWKHQKQALKKIEPRFALFMEEGTGKTLVYLYSLSKLLPTIRRSSNKRPYKVLIVSTRQIIKHMWPKALEEHGHVLPGEWEVTLETFGCVRTRKEAYTKEGFDAIIIDEASKIKNGSLQTRAIQWVARRGNIPIRIIGTGTPWGNAQGMEIFHYSKFLFDYTSVFGQNMAHFKEEYYDEGDSGWDWEPKDDTFDRFSEIIDKWSFRKLKSECLDLPPKVYKVHELDGLTGLAKKLYDAIKKNTMILVNEHRLDSSCASNRQRKLLQLAAGTLYFNDSSDDEHLVEIFDELGLSFTMEDLEDLHTPKLDWLKDILPELVAQEGDVMIVGNHTKALDRVWDLLVDLDIPFEANYGDSECDPEGDEYRVLLANVDSIAFGLNLQRLSDVIYYENPWSYEVRKQSSNRAHRGGQTHEVTIHDPLVKGTPDRYVLHTLRQCKDVSDTIFWEYGEEF